MEIMFKKTVTKEMLIMFFEGFLASWPTDQTRDERWMNNEHFLKETPMNSLYTIKSLAQKQTKKILKAIEKGNEEQFAKLFDNLAGNLAYEYFKMDIKNVNCLELPTFTFCQLIYRNNCVFVHAEMTEARKYYVHGKYSELLFTIATAIFKVNPHPCEL